VPAKLVSGPLSHQVLGLLSGIAKQYLPFSHGMALPRYETIGFGKCFGVSGRRRRPAPDNGKRFTLIITMNPVITMNPDFWLSAVRIAVLNQKSGFINLKSAVI
jgi:hypothetical protein